MWCFIHNSSKRVLFFVVKETYKINMYKLQVVSMFLLKIFHFSNILSKFDFLLVHLYKICELDISVRVPFWFYKNKAHFRQDKQKMANYLHPNEETLVSSFIRTLFDPYTLKGINKSGSQNNSGLE